MQLTNILVRSWRLKKDEFRVSLEQKLNFLTLHEFISAVAKRGYLICQKLGGYATMSDKQGTLRWQDPTQASKGGFPWAVTVDAVKKIKEKENFDHEGSFALPVTTLFFFSNSHTVDEYGNEEQDEIHACL